ncbi:MAG: hypothetical protein F6J97_18345, partial [Leptolyngbya sp. SIO4C1]|nr:hypothetical protein [Leptolyngbya sp. SIO4C1]
MYDRSITPAAQPRGAYERSERGHIISTPELASCPPKRSHFASCPNLAPGPSATARPKPVVRAEIAPSAPTGAPSRKPVASAQNLVATLQQPQRHGPPVKPQQPHRRDR